MTTQIHNAQQGLVKDLRKIRDQISDEIKDMTFEEERTYLDKLLAERERSLRPTVGFGQAGQTQVQ